jgi:hypothetical protein
VGGVVGGGVYNNPGSGVYLIPWGTGTNNSETNASIPVPPGTARNLYVHLSTAISGTQTVTIQVRKNGTGVMSCTVPASGQNCSDTSSTVTFSGGDLLSILYTEVNNPGPRVSLTFSYLSQ